MLWIFDRLVEETIISPDTAIRKINDLFARNIIYQNNAELISEKRKRINIWKK
jgi:hypothetical protein